MREIDKDNKRPDKGDKRPGKEDKQSDKDNKRPDQPDDSKPMEDSDDKLIRFKVNGTELESNFDKLIALDILAMAKKKDAFEGKIEDYVLERGDDKFKPDEWVDLKDGESFLAILQGPTQVA